MKAVAVLMLLGSVAVLKVAADNAAELAAAAASKDKYDYEKHGHGKDYDHHKNRGYKGPHYGGKDEYYGHKGPHYGGKDEYYGSKGYYGGKDEYYGSKGPYYGGKDDYYGGKDDYYGGRNEYYGGKNDYYGGIPPYDYDGKYGYGYTEPSYPSYGYNDYGYHGGPPGRQIIHLDLVEQDEYNECEGSITIGGTRSVAKNAARVALKKQRCSAAQWDDSTGRCGSNPDIEFSVTCGVKHHPYGYGDSYYGDKVVDTFPDPDEIPILGDGNIELDLEENGPAKVGKHTWGSVKGSADGEIDFCPANKEAAGRCNSILYNTDKITYDELEVIFVPAKLDLKAVPSIFDNLIPVGSSDSRRRSQRRITSSNTTKGKADSATPAKLSAASIPQEYYDDDGLLCGMAILAKGDVKLYQFSAAAARAGRTGGISELTYKGTIWFTLYWTNGLLEVPSWFGEQYNGGMGSRLGGGNTNNALNGGFNLFNKFIQVGGDVNGPVLPDGGEEITELLHKWCKYHKETILVEPGKVTLDVAPVPAV